MGDLQHFTRRAPGEQLPPFWMRAQDSQGRPVDPRIVAVSERMWSWAYRHVEWELHDAASAAQLMEEVALEVSGRLQEEPRVGEHLAGYFSTAFRHRVRQQFARENRVAYEGLLRELEQNHHLAAPNWEAAMERKLCLKVLIISTNYRSHHVTCFTTGFWDSPGMRSAGRFTSPRSKPGLDFITS